MQKLGDYIKEYSARNKQNEDIPVYSVTNSNGFCRDYFGKEVASSNKKTYKIVPRNAFAYNPSRINVGSVDYQHYEDRVIVSPLYNVFTVDERVVSEYLYFYLKNPNTIKRIKAVASGSVRDNLKLSMLYEFPISLPSVSDQKTIVKTINKVQAVIDSKKSALEKLDNLIKARFVEMFGDGFETIELRNICKTTSGGTPSTKNPDYYNGTIPWVTTTALGPNHIDGTKAKAYISEEAVANSATKIIPSGSILFGIRVGVGKTSINDVDICTNQDIVAIMDVNETKFSKLFIKHVLDANRAHYDSMKKGATILGITSDDLKNTPIPLAPIKAQKDFETFVEQVDKSKFAISQSLLLLIKAFSASFIPYSGQISALLSSRDKAG